MLGSMPERVWRVAVLDSGIAPLPSRAVSQIRRFVDEGDRVREREPLADPIGHGTVVTEIIAAAMCPPQLVVAQILNERGRCTPAVLAAAIDWALAQRAQLLHLSVGLHQDRGVLRSAVERAVASGALMVAATPARGTMAYPAFYPGVIRATGDARCRGEEISHLGTPGADFGACPAYESSSARVSRGASIGAAHLSRFIVTHIDAGLAAAPTGEALIRFASFHGPERRHRPPSHGQREPGCPDPVTRPLDEAARDDADPRLGRNCRVLDGN